MANKPACTHGGPPDREVCTYAHTYTDTHAQFLLQPEETQSEYKTWGWALGKCQLCLNNPVKALAYSFHKMMSL